MSAPFSAMKEFLFLILGLLPSLAFASGPGTAALDFLEKVRKGELNLNPGGDTALQKHTTDGKREIIRKGIERLGADLRDGELEIGEVKEDTGFAAVMIRKVVGFDSSEIRIYPVALVKRGAEWLPAPVLASFENAVAGYTLPIRERLSGLENWMMRERVVDLETLIAKSSQRTRARIRESIIGQDLEGDDLAKITGLFLKACAAKDRAAILGFLGGLGDPLPDDWAARLAVSRAAVEGQGPWRLLVAPEVVRIPVLEEQTKGSGMISIACLDPAIMRSSGTMQKIRIIHLELVKNSSGHWRMDLPTVLMSGDEDMLADEEGLDVDLLDRFPKRLREVEPVTKAATARAALDGVIESLRSPSLRELLRRVDFGRRPKDGRIACSAAAEVWWTLNEPGSLRFPLEMGFQEEGDSAAAVFQWFSVNDADRFEPVTMFFKKSSDGWVWAPGIVSEDDREDHQALSKWVKVNEPDWRLSWREELMKPGTELRRLGFERVATDTEIGKLVADWISALEQKDIRTVFSLSAWLGDEGEIPMKALRNLSYDLSNFKEGAWELEGIHRSGSWVCASVRQTVEDGVRNAFVPVVMTPSGPRILPEIDFFAEDNRTRDFLNKASFDRLEKFAGEEKTAELRRLFATFREKLTKVD